ncbi:MAG: TonB-dependent receptor domain-containing protein [Steroidobacteraceae bacterium]
MNGNLRRAVRLALATSAAASSLLGTSAIAQDQSSAELGEVTVTGTRIQRQDYSATSPVVTLDAAQLQQAGTVQIDTVLNQLPQLVPTLSIGSNNPSASGGAGQALIDMRGLGAGRTLVLLDGTRLVPSHTSGQIDVNTVPSALIDNIEVLTGGAGAVYGSDAIAGVVNIKLKQRFEGVQIDTQFGQTAESDGEQTAIDVTMGGNFNEDRGNAVLALSYDERKSILAGDRRFGQQSFAPDLSAFGSSTIPEGRFDTSITNLPSQAAIDAVFAGYGVGAGTVSNTDNLGFNSDGTLFDITGTANYRGPDFVGFNADSFSYNYAPVNYLVLPLERKQIFAAGSFNMAEFDTGSVEAYARLMYTTYEAEQQLAATPITGLTVPVSNPNIPADLSSILASRPDPAAPYTFRIRTTEVGERVATPNYDVMQGLVGFRGDFQVGERDWNWDFYASWGRTETTERQTGNVSFSRIQGLLDGVDLTNCAAADFNPFGIGNMTAACASAIGISATNITEIEQTNALAVVSGELFDMPAGPFQFAAGASYGENSGDFKPDEFLASGDVVGFNAQTPQSGSINVAEAFVEFAIPLLRDLPLVHSLDLETGFRYSDYNLAGGVETYKAALNWAPIESLKVRGSYNRAVRAPSIEDLFLPPQENFPGYSDPCNFDSPQRAGSQAAQVEGLCQAQGIPAGVLPIFLQPNNQVRAIQGGNLELEPESADTYTVGLVWQPEFEEVGMRTSIDYWSYDVTKTIGAVGATSSISRCFNDVGANPTFDPNNQWCQLWTRLASGEITDVQENQQNLGALKADGVDFQIDYSVPISDRYGRLNANLLVTRLLTWKFQEDVVSPFGEFQGNITIDVAESFPEWKGVLSLGWEVGQFGLNWQARYIDGMTVVNDDALGSPVTTSVVPTTPSIDYHRITATWAMSDSIDFLVGVDNVFDQDPPIYADDTQAGQQANTEPSTFDILGRRYFASATFRF